MKRAVTFCVLVFFALIVSFAVGVIQLVLTAERSLVAEVMAGKIICIYIEKNGKWPNSWEDLSTIELPEQSNFAIRGLKWPDNIEFVRKLVEIDFDYSVKRLSTESFEEFSAIKQSNETYTGHKRAIFIELQKAANSKSLSR